jgi:hypothetical protein
MKMRKEKRRATEVNIRGEIFWSRRLSQDADGKRSECHIYRGILTARRPNPPSKMNQGHRTKMEDRQSGASYCY